MGEYWLIYAHSYFSWIRFSVLVITNIRIMDIDPLIWIFATIFSPNLLSIYIVVPFSLWFLWMNIGQATPNSISCDSDWVSWLSQNSKKNGSISINMNICHNIFLLSYGVWISFFHRAFNIFIGWYWLRYAHFYLTWLIFSVLVITK